MKDLERKTWELKKKIVCKVTSAAAKSVVGVIAVPLEVVAHVCPAYWVYKMLSYKDNPLVREMETLYIFDSVGEDIKEIETAKKELDELKEQEKKEKETAIPVKTDLPLNNEILAQCRELIIKSKVLDTQTQSLIINRIKTLLISYSNSYKMAVANSEAITALNNVTKAKLHLIDEGIDNAIKAQKDLAEFQKEQAVVYSLIEEHEAKETPTTDTTKKVSC